MRSNLTWSYNPPNGNFPSQSAWNQTLMTKINELSAIIHRKYNSGGGNLLYISSNIKKIIESLEHYNNGSFGSRYKVIFTESNKNIIKIVGNAGHSHMLVVTDYVKKLTSVDGSIRKVSENSTGRNGWTVSNTDAEAELTAMLSEQFADGIDKEVLSELTKIIGIKTNRRRLLIGR